MHRTIDARRLPVGGEVRSEGGVHFRVWAPARRRVEVVLEASGRGPGGSPRGHPLTREEGGYFSGDVAEAAPGTRYRYRLDDDAFLYPDPASRFQPEGPHGPSEVVDPDAFAWTDHGWAGVSLKGQVLYEMHVGTFTPEGTWQAAAEQLPELAETGITLIEVMPVSDFPGRFGWGYDGVSLFAPTRLYGPPDDFRRFVDRAHALGLGVILDVVYNHCGPDGCFLKQFTERYFSERHTTEWGEAINFDGEQAGPVRAFFLANAAYWIREFHLDGLRLDATQNIYDEGSEHILTEIVRTVREAAQGRATLVIGENEPQQVKLLQAAERGGHSLDALWNDDFHRSAMVALTGRNEGYFTDYLGTPQELLSAVKWGYLYQGQWYRWQGKRRGTPALHLPGEVFVTYLQNHDQIANSGRGDRLHKLTSPGRYRALTALLLLAPGTPMLFQGQEFAASSPFLYFADHKPEIAQLVRKGRKEFVAQFRNLALPEVQEQLPDPDDPATFERCKLDFTERQRHAEVYALHRDLLRLRREDPVLRAQDRARLHGAVLGPEAFVLRFFGAADDDRLLVVNLGRDLHLDPAPEPLLGPPVDRRWTVLWSAEDVRYGGTGTPPLDNDGENWRIPGHAAVVLAPGPPPREGAREGEPQAVTTS